MLGMMLLMAVALIGCGLLTHPDSSYLGDVVLINALVSADSVPDILKCADCGIVTTSLSKTGARTWSQHYGTSFAAPYVSAAAGMLKAQGLSAAQVKSRLIATARPLGIGPGDLHYGAGMLDIAAALGKDTRPAVSVTEMIALLRSVQLPTSRSEPTRLTAPLPTEYSLVLQVKQVFEAELRQVLARKGYDAHQLEHVWVIEGGVELNAVAEELAKSGYVTNVAVHQVLHTMEVSVDDPRFSQQWALPYTAFPQAWEMPANANLTPITIAVLDSGVSTDHPDLQGVSWEAPCTMVHGNRMLYPAKYKMEPPDVAFQQPAQTYCWNDVPDDVRGHGTSVTGIIAAVRNNQLGISGAGYGADASSFRIMPVKVINDMGGGTSATIAYGIYYAVVMGADVINLSLGLHPGSRLDADLVTALAYAAENDVVVVAASGNDWMAELSPLASYPTVISVGAVSIWGTRAAYSNYGPDLDLVAPGGARTDELTTVILASSTGIESDLINIFGYSAATLGVWYTLPVGLSTPEPVFIYAWLDTDLNGTLNYGDYYDFVGPLLPEEKTAVTLNLQLYEGPEKAMLVGANVTNR